jgi:fibronectin type 3 domain-containing protein
MKKTLCLIGIILLCFWITNGYAGYYSYSLKGTSGNSIISTDAGGNTDFSLNMKVWINDDHSITSKIERKDGQYFTHGNIFLQTTTNIASSERRIDCGENNGVSNVYSKTLTSVESLAHMAVNWTDDSLSLYGIYESGNQYAWVGPVIIQRQVKYSAGNLKVSIYPHDAAMANAQWKYEIPNRQNQWSPWYNSGDEINGISEGRIRIQFNDISSRWVTPDDIYVDIKNGQLTSTEALYISTFSSIHGIIVPQEAAHAGASWSAWNNLINQPTGPYQSNSTKTGFPPGATQVEFLPIPGWTSPPIQTIVVRADEATIVTGLYCKDIPYAPQHVAATKGSDVTKVVITWDKVLCVNQYHIYRSTTSSPSAVDRIATNHPFNRYEDTEGEAGKEYYYFVQAVNEKNDGVLSDSAIGYKKIDRPSQVMATDGIFTDFVRIEWEMVPGAISYQIFRNTDSSSASAELIANNVNECIYDDYSGAPEKTYYYWVKAKNSIMTSDLSDNDQGHSRLASPRFIDASDFLFTDKVEIKWQPVEKAIGYQVDHYVESSRQTRKRQQDVRSQAETYYWHTTAIPCKTYYYRVRAYNQYGYSDWTHYDAGSREMEAPIIHASKGTYENRIRVSWSSVHGAMHYYVFQNISDDFSTAQQLPGKAIGNYMDIPGIDNQEVYFWVQAMGEYCKKMSLSDKGYLSPDCQFFVSHESVEMDASGGSGIITVSSETNNDQSNCPWYAESLNEDWVHITSGIEGYGEGTILYEVSENKRTDPRSGIIALAGEAVVINQKAMEHSSLWIAKTGSGQIKVNGIEQDLPFQQSIVPGNTMTIEAVPASGWQFAHFSGSHVDTENPLQINTNSNVNLIANFVQETFCLNVTLVGKGSVYQNGDNALLKCYPKGEVVKLRAETELQSPYDFTNWAGDLNHKNPETSLIMDSDKAVTAFFSGWSAIIESKGVDMGSYYKTEVTIGVGSEPYQTLSPPTPPWYSSYMSILSLDKDVTVDIQLDGKNTYTWLLSVDPHGNVGNAQEESHSMLSWDPAHFSSQGTYRLIEGIDPETSVVVIDNMRETTQYTITGISERQNYSVVWENNSCEPPNCGQHCTGTALIALTLNGENLGGMHTFNASIGRDNFEKTTSAPPKPPNYSAYMAIVSKDWQHLSTQVHNRETLDNEWLIVVNPVGLRESGAISTASLSWTFPQLDEGYFELVKVTFEGEQMIENEQLVENMRQTHRLDISGDNTDQYFLIKYHCLDDPCITDPAQCQETFTMELFKGWNMIALPLVMPDKRLNAIFPEAQEVYSYNNGSYHLIENKTGQLENGVGYWISMPEDRIYELHGAPYQGLETSLEPGWHLLGCPFAETVPESSPVGAIESMFDYTNKSYNYMTSCQPGLGFWVNIVDVDNSHVSVAINVFSESE